MPLQTHPTRDQFPAGLRFEGHAIVSTDGMIAAADGSMPDRLRNDVDWRQFQGALDGSSLVVLGRTGHERHPNPGRRRLVFTSRVAGFSTDPGDPLATLYNPAHVTLAQVLDRIGVINGTVAVTGGTSVFDYFLPIYNSFSLVEVQQFKMPEGRPCLRSGHPRTVLAAAGLVPRHFEVIDTQAALTRTLWGY
jgi:dihydrofolate reductase